MDPEGFPCQRAPQGVDFELPPLPGMRTPKDDAEHVLLGVGPLVNREVNLDEFLQALVDRVARAMQADRGTLWLVDAARQELFSRAAHLPEVKQIRVKLGQGVAGSVAASGGVLNIPTATGDQRVHGDIDRLTGYRTRTLLAVPLTGEDGEIFGVLQVLNRLGGGRFEREDEERLVAMGAQVSEALQRTSLYTELKRARAAPGAPVGYFFNRVIGESKAMKAIYRVVQKAAQTDATVLIRGESGSGKELIARAVHVNSRRRDATFVKVDCAALPAGLIENELFGHEKGAFTGADARAPGKFEIAKGGTVFLDELGELPPAVQGKLLRVLQDRQLERLGGHDTVNVDVRIVAATNRDLARMVKEGTFREDLYYRIKVVEAVLPPLRERGPEDVERLARHFVAEAARRHHLARAPVLSGAALTRLLAWSWPGNVRELEHCIESAVVLCDGEIGPEHLALPDAAPTAAAEPPPQGESALKLEEIERRHILFVLERARGNRSLAAEWLGIGRNTLQRKLKAYGVREGP
ncbi:MAG: sigma-54-dependent Fis family transcriptional regulator [Myxococcaceae bacterium]|nr:sigma-54-dependent Fis family transcriptional regulator [Myxococcaceae bacterium]